MNKKKKTREQHNQQHHCGQDACTAVNSAEQLKQCLGWEVISVGDMPCEGCPHEHYGAPCVKLELVGGYYICLAPTPNSIITE